ncbi:hypothetical protein K6989_02635 [Mycoplasmopsis synoviae]|uniref:hypothetical protein n=1 Tax=Mycoplasmopsis synoviae TaxID=2109 RepID=UPI001CE1CBC1|nr:hypothetical protein [Mycoplasmopsis synoviae]UBX97259.1 hypothetical protein K6989_02635 [Mycoplasmopsis synoviae]UBX98885.1 hypothetical protein K6986_00815 [Mycoplasmopsis synoviae]
MKKTKIIILSSLVFSTIGPALAISCGINTNQNKKNQNQETKTKNANDKNLALKKSDNFIDLNTKINYVALGDSITAGFDGTFPDDFPGKLENNKITGSSYPAFLAKIFNKQNRIA